MKRHNTNYGRFKNNRSKVNEKRHLMYRKDEDKRLEIAETDIVSLNTYEKLLKEPPVSPHNYEKDKEGHVYELHKLERYFKGRIVKNIRENKFGKVIGCPYYNFKKQYICIDVVRVILNKKKTKFNREIIDYNEDGTPIYSKVTTWKLDLLPKRYNLYNMAILYKIEKNGRILVDNEYTVLAHEDAFKYYKHCVYYNHKFPYGTI